MYYQPKHLNSADLRAYRRNQRRLNRLKHLKRVMINVLKAALPVLNIASCLWLGWLLVSFIDVNAHNMSPETAQHLWLGSWNAFKLLF